MYSFEQLKKALKKRDEVKYRLLRMEVRKVKAFIEKMLSLAFESTANQARTSYSGLEMY